MSARTKARKRALDVLFQAEVRHADAVEVLSEIEGRLDGPINPYTREIVVGVTAHKARIDELIVTYSEDWPLERMPGVDRNLLRIGTWELLYSDQVPDAVAVDEAVELCRSLSTDNSPGFVNGVLGQIIDVKSHLVIDHDVPPSVEHDPKWDSDQGQGSDEPVTVME
jgi:N utilization substance protein B